MVTKKTASAWVEQNQQELKWDPRIQKLPERKRMTRLLFLLSQWEENRECKCKTEDN